MTPRDRQRLIVICFMLLLHVCCNFLIPKLYSQENGPVETATEQQKFVYDAKGKRDPFVPTAKMAVNKPSLGISRIRIEGIIFDNIGGSFAMINGEVLRVGDTIGGVTIKGIETNRVIFERENGQLFDVVVNKENEMLKKFVQGPKDRSENKDKEQVQTAENTNDNNNGGLENLAELTRQKVFNEGE